jgi:tagatose-6-phosphate ketose/aldose isomerase
VSKSVEVLGLTAAQIRAGGADWTAREIAQQPRLWPEIARFIAGDAALAGFLAPLLGTASLRVVLTGAGTSSFIGECLAPALVRTALRAEAVASTDIVASPESYLASRTRTLMVHFARSGNSPESVAALDLAEQHIEHCAHLVVTCNRSGELYRRVSAMRNAHAVVLPEDCNDQSFAMTSSFTGMLLAAAVAFRVLGVDGVRVARLPRLGTHVMTSCLSMLANLANGPYERVVYLGSGELKGLAREAALKMLELSDGRIVSVADTPLGFRHGPKTIVKKDTLVITFLSNDVHARRYDLDLVAELRRDGAAGRVIALSGRADIPPHADTLVLSEGAPPHSRAVVDGADARSSDSALTDLELCLPYAVVAQSLALLRSLSLGISPDRPNAAGTVNRVVQGVSIYSRERLP